MSQFYILVDYARGVRLVALFAGVLCWACIFFATSPRMARIEDAVVGLSFVVVMFCNSVLLRRY